MHKAEPRGQGGQWCHSNQNSYSDANYLGVSPTLSQIRITLVFQQKVVDFDQGLYKNRAVGEI